MPTTHTPKRAPYTIVVKPFKHPPLWKQILRAIGKAHHNQKVTY